MEPTDNERRVPARYAPGEGCVTQVVRIPVRIVVLVLVVPVRLVWDALTAAGRAVDRSVLRPLGRGLARLWRTLVVVPLAWAWRTLVVLPLGWTWRTLIVAPLGWLWRAVLAPAGRGTGRAVAWLVRRLLVLPAQWLYTHVLTPVGHGLAWLLRGLGTALGWLGRALFVWPWVTLWRYVLAPVGRGTGAVLAWLVRVLVVVPAQWLYLHVLTPAGRGLAWLVRGLGTVLATLVRWLVVVPLVTLWRYVLVPAGRLLTAAVTAVVRETATALGHCWRAAGIISRALGRLLAAVLRWVLVEPLRWVYRTVLTPLGHGIRDGIWRPVRQALRTARATVRQTRGEIRRALFGAPAQPRPATAAEPRREPEAPGTRTLGSSTTALTKD
ncbi:hypothetical protein [Streptomyces sp. CA2R101]|uniref:hypothetical protein n=1 Tax=Streptomyces sp. CA2R101 TaxID=3120152 RepID=UPI0030090F7F